MQTNFFSQIQQLNISGNLRINIQPQEDGELIVSLLLDTSFVKDKATKLIPPLVLKGNESDLDHRFFDAISQPLKSTQTLLLNMQEHIKATDKAQKESHMVKDKEEAHTLSRIFSEPEKLFHQPCSHRFTSKINMKNLLFMLMEIAPMPRLMKAHLMGFKSSLTLSLYWTKTAFTNCLIPTW